MVKQTQNKSTSIIIKHNKQYKKKVIFTPEGNFSLQKLLHCYFSKHKRIQKISISKILQKNQKLPWKKMLPSKVMTPKRIKCKNGKRKETEIHVKYSIIMLIMYSKERQKERKSLVVGLNFTFILICFSFIIFGLKVASLVGLQSKIQGNTKTEGCKKL